MNTIIAILYLSPLVGLFYTPTQRVVMTPAPVVENREVIARDESSIRNETLKEYAKRRVTETWKDGEWTAFDTLIQKESGWSPTVCNRKSTACGLGQFLRQTRANYGITTESAANEQIEAIIKYIQDRYSSPTKALKFHNINNYY